MNPHVMEVSRSLTFTREYVDHSKDPIYSLKMFQKTMWNVGDLKLRLPVANGDVLNFPILLYVLLNDTSKDSTNRQIVVWDKDGRGFKLHNRKAFEDDVMPRFFRSKKFSTFQKQLKCYQFSRIKDGRKAGSYIHPFFLRGRPDLLGQVERLGQRRDCLPSGAGFKSDSLENLSDCQELTHDQILALCPPCVVPQLKNILHRQQQQRVPASNRSNIPGSSPHIEPQRVECASDSARRLRGMMNLPPPPSRFHTSLLPITPISFPSERLEDIRTFPFDGSVAEEGQQIVNCCMRGEVYFLPL